MRRNAFVFDLASDEESICSEAVPLLQSSRNSRKCKDSDNEMREIKVAITLAWQTSFHVDCTSTGATGMSQILLSNAEATPTPLVHIRAASYQEQPP